MNAIHLCKFCKTYTARLKDLVLVAITLTMFGCAAPPHIKDIETPITGQTVVLGSVEVVEDGKPKEWNMTWTGMQKLRLLILPPGKSQAVVYNLAKDGSFSWGLSPGEYMIAGYELSKGSQFQTGRIWARFNVPQGVESLYIGDLNLSINKGLYRFEIKDDYDTAVENYKTKFPNAPDVPLKGLLEPERKLGSSEHARYICAEEWGIECTDKFSGVTPVHPDKTLGNFGEVHSLTPRFEWKPSSNKDVTYDLLIYEAASYSRSGIDIQYMLGRVAVYKEGLKTSTWQLDTPLKPNQQYFWSVRLRQDGVVSNWSKYSYFGFYVFAWSSGYGKWFNFSTPAK